MPTNNESSSQLNKGREMTPGEIAKKYHKQSQQMNNPRLLKKHFGHVHTPTEFQMEVSECGAASLSMIMQYYGKYVALEELRIETGVSRNGCNAKNICLAAEHYGMSVEATSRALDTVLRKNTAPCMIHWNFSHFVVFEGVKGNKYYINDPSIGRRKLTRDEMMEGYSGTVLQFAPTDKFVKSKNKRTLFRFAINRLHGQGLNLLAMFLIGLALIAPGVLSPVFSQVFTDYILIHGQNNWMKWLLLAMFLSTFFSAYFSYMSANLSMLLKEKLSLLSSDSMIAHMLRLPISFFEQRYAGDLVSRVYNNIAVSQFLADQVIQLFINLITSVVYLIIMICYSPILSLIGVGFSVFSMLIAYFTSRAMVNMTMKFGMDSGKLSGALYNGINSTASLKAVGAEGEYVSRILGYYAEVSMNDQKLGRLQSAIDIIPKTLGILNNVSLLIIGSRYVISGSLTPGMMIAFSGFLSSFSSPFGGIVGFVRNMQQMKNDLRRVEDIMNYKEEDGYFTEKDESLEGRKLNGEIDMVEVDFAYGKLDKPLISDFNLHADPGKTIALVGKSGCGKSTISKLLCGLYHPWLGTIKFDGHEVETIPTSVISSSISVVTQDISLFEGSISDNISAWNQSITLDEIVCAAKDACIHEEITQKQGGYDYRINENASNLSGGQKQRIEIAKALATNPTILLLDEATSSLDTTTEKKILDNIKKRNCTMIVVAQRLSTIRDCDEIIVIEKGKAVERGSHEQLMSLKNKYYKLVMSSEVG